MRLKDSSTGRPRLDCYHCQWLVVVACLFVCLVAACARLDSVAGYLALRVWVLFMLFVCVCLRAYMCVCVTEFLGADYNDCFGKLRCWRWYGCLLLVLVVQMFIVVVCIYVSRLAHSAQLTLDRQVRLAKSRWYHTELCAVKAAKSSGDVGDGSDHGSIVEICYAAA